MRERFDFNEWAAQIVDGLELYIREGLCRVIGQRTRANSGVHRPAIISRFRVPSDAVLVSLCGPAVPRSQHPPCEPPPLGHVDRASSGACVPSNLLSLTPTFYFALLTATPTAGALVSHGYESVDLGVIFDKERRCVQTMRGGGSTREVRRGTV